MEKKGMIMDFRIEAIKPYETSGIYKYKNTENLSEKDIEDIKKLYLLNENNKNILKLTNTEYKTLLNKRPLLKFRPLRNSFLKKGDKKLLAASLEIKETQVKNYIYNYIKNGFKSLSQDKKEMLNAYVYRHGTKDQALSFFENELSNAKSALKRLYKTLDKNSGGLYYYFERPCHLLDNKTAHSIHTIIKYGLDNAQKQGFVTEDINKTACEWALRQIYDIQSNQKLREALKITKYNG